MNTDLRAELAESGRRQRAERRPVDMAEIMAAVDAASVSLDASIDSTVHSVEQEADGPRGEALMFDSRWSVDESSAPSERKRWIGALTAVAAVVLIVAGVVVLAARDSGDVEPDAPSSPSVTDPPPPPEESAPPLSVVDSLGYRWSRVPHDDAIFGVDSAGFDAVMTDVIAGGPGLVAVGTDGSHYDQYGFEESGALEFGDAAVWTSTDGLTWSRVPHDEEVFGGAAMNGVTTGGPGLVAVGETISGAAVWTSVDGTTWSRVPHDDEVFAGADMTRVTEGGPGLVAVGPSFSEDGAQVWTSADGLTWSRVPDDDEVFGGAGIRDVTAGGPGLVAVGSFADEAAGVAQRAAVWTSVDGLTWSRVPHDEAMFGGGDEQRMTAVAVGGPGLVAVGWFANEGLYDQGTAVWTSVDGHTWSRLPYDEAVWGYGNVTSVVPVDSGLVAVGADYAPWLGDRGGRVWTSPDGITWSRAPHETFFDKSTMASVTVGGPGLVAVGDTFGSDSDGVVWTATLEDDSVEADPAALVVAYQDAINARDLDAAVAVFATDARIVNHPQRRIDVVGEASIRGLNVEVLGFAAAEGAYEFNGIETNGTTVTIGTVLFRNDEGACFGGGDHEIEVEEGKVIRWTWGTSGQPCS